MLSANLLFALIIGFIIFEFALSHLLSYLNARNWKDQIPSEMKAYYDEAKYKKAKDYYLTRRRFGVLTGVISTAAILIFLWFDGFAYLDHWLRGYTEHPVGLALLFFGVLFILSDLLSLPASLYSTFVIEERFGFNKTTPKTFITDKLKGYALGAIIGGILMGALVLFYQKAGSNFWWIAWLIVSGFSLFMAAFYTSLLLPLFNKLTPLDEGSLRSKIQTYANKVDFPLKNIFIMDGSKRSAKSNAFFSGMGSSKSIVLFDTLVEEHTEEELVAVLAHEVGHYKKKHIQQSMIISVLQTGLMFFILGVLLSYPQVYEALGVAKPSFHIGILAFGLLWAPISLLTGIGMNMFSRKNEFEADHFAKTTYQKEPMVEALKKLSVHNLSNLYPHPWTVFFSYSHPPLLERLAALESN